MGIRVKLFGLFSAEHDGSPPTPIEWPRKQTQQLFKILVCQRGQTLSQDQLFELLFPNLEPKSAARNLHKRISELRSALEPDRPKGQPSSYIESPTQGSYRFSNEAPCDIDTESFLKAIENSSLQRENGQLHSALESLQEALEIGRNEFLVGDLYEDWAVKQREYWRDLYLNALLSSAEIALELGNFPFAIELTSQLITEAPSREEAYGLKMRSHYFMGEHQQALATFEQCERALKIELGLTPSPAIQDIYVQILNGTLKRPRPAVPNNLQEPLTRFIGREKEMREINERFDQGGSRLLTLLGHGGIGKSRLALQIAIERLCRHSDGVYWVELAPLHDANQIVYAIGAALNLKFGGREAPVEQLLGHLANRNIMLVLDNFEHLVDEAELVHQMLERAPSLVVLATSREPLNLLGEHIFDLEGLRVPEVVESEWTEDDAHFTSTALALFRESALRADPTFELTGENVAQVSRICKLAQGAPLAIELAASWIRTLSLERMAEEIETNLNFLSTRMRNLPERHRSMRAVFGSTWERITAREQEFFTKLSIFKGGFSYKLASQIVDLELTDLSDLVSRSLLKTSHDERYEIHELLRQYGEEILEEQDERAALKDRHLQIFQKLAADSESQIRGPDHTDWMDLLDAERANFKSALQWGIESQNSEGVIGLASSLALYWEVHGDFSEGRYWLDKALEMSDGADSSLQAKALRWVGMIATRQGDYGAAEEYLKRSAEIYKTLDEGAGLARVYYILGGLTQEIGSYETSRGYLFQALEIYQKLNQKRGIGDVYNLLGLNERHHRNYERCVELHTKSLEIYREIGDRDRVSSVLLNLGYALQRIDRDEEAVAMIEESIEIMKELKNRGKLIRAWELLGMSLVEQDRFEESEKCYQDSQQLALDLGQKFSLMLINMNWGWLEYVRENFSQARSYWERSQQYAIEIEAHQHIYWNHAFLGLLSSREGKYDEARSLIKSGLENYTAHDPGCQMFLLLGLSDVLIHENAHDSAAVLAGYLESKIRTIRRHAQQDLNARLSELETRMSPEALSTQRANGVNMSHDEIVIFAKEL